MPENCERPTREMEIVGVPCDDCGHTNLVHPGPHNPSLQCCMLCAIETLRREMRGE